MSETVQYMWSSEYVGTLRDGEVPFEVWRVTSELGEKKEVERNGREGWGEEERQTEVQKRGHL